MVNMDESDDKKKNKSSTWARNIDFFFNILGWIVGLGNVWRFPYLCYENGGGAFLVAYFSLIVVFVFPIMVLESALGQYTRQVVVTAWKVVPIYRGIGYAILVTKVYGFFYPVLLAWAMRWFFASFSSSLPWTTCGNSWNTDKCFNISGGRSNLSTLNETVIDNSTSLDSRSSSVEEYWRRNILGMTARLEDYGDMRWDLLGCLFLVWIINYFSIWKGVNWTSKIIYVTSTLPLAMILVVTIRGLTLPGSWNGVSFYLKTDIGKLGNVKVWKDAAAQVLYSVGACGGVFTTMSSYNKYKHNFVRDLLFLVIANALVSLTSGFAIFSVLGFLAEQQNVSVADVAESGPGLVFVVYPTALSLLPLPQFWSALFFLMLLLLGLDSLFVEQELVLACLPKIFPKFFRRKWGTELGLAIMDLFAFLYGATMVTGGGIYIFHIANTYGSIGWCMFFIGLNELVGVGWLYGADRLMDNMDDMLGYRVPRIWFKLCWKFITPIATALLMIYSLIQYRPLVYDRVYVYPVWANVIGWMMTLSSVLLIPGFAIYTVWTAEGNTIKEKLMQSIDPTEERNIVDERAETLKHLTDEEDKM